MIRIVTECMDSCGRALRTIRRVRKCVCDWGITEGNGVPIACYQGMVNQLCVTGNGEAIACYQDNDNPIACY